MAEDMKGSTKTTKRKVMECFISEMGEYMRESGRMGSSMGKDFFAKRIW